MDAFSKRLRLFFWPAVAVPEEDEYYKYALSFRNAKVAELRETLQMDSSLDAKIDGITAQLLSARVESKV